MRLERTMLFVRDLGRMTAFYRDVVGLTPNEATRLEDWVEFDADGAGLALHAIPGARSDQTDAASPPLPREQTPCKLVFSCEDPEAERARLEGLGVTILHRPWGGWDAVDPEGNVFGVQAR